jgi:hypothetical protein
LSAAIATRRVKTDGVNSTDTRYESPSPESTPVPVLEAKGVDTGSSLLKSESTVRIRDEGERQIKAEKAYHHKIRCTQRQIRKVNEKINTRAIY